MSPVPPAELTAELTIEEPEARRAVLDATGPTGLALETGPTTVALSGARGAVLDVLRTALEAAIGAGARGVQVVVDQPTESRDD